MMKKMILYIAALALILSSCRREEYRTLEGAVWGTVYHITYRADRDLSDSVTAMMRRVELSLSMFDPASTVSRINRGETSEADSMFADVYALSARVNRLSGGFFDPTVAPLVDLWGFGRKGRDFAVPSQAAIDSVMTYVGFAHTAMHGRQVVKDDPRVEFDFSAIAKGYGVDRVAEALRRAGATDYMVEIGGEVVAAGLNPRGKDWRIALDAPLPTAPGDSIFDVIQLRNQAVATSGNYRNYHDISPDSVFGHTINPLDGQAARRMSLSATVIAPTCALADALATACMMLPPERALALADSLPDVRIIIVSLGPDGWTTLQAP